MSDTKTRILDAAETLFAEHGFAGTSLRDITAEASVNLAAVNYHFGSKEALLSAVFDRRIRPVNEERLRLLDELEHAATGSRLDLQEVLQAFLLPPFRKMQEWGSGGAKFMQLVGRTHSEANEQIRAGFLRHFEVILKRFAPALQRAVPDLPGNELHRRMHFVVGAMAHTLVWSHTLQERDEAQSAPIFDSLLRFAVAGLEAPVESPAAGHVR